MLVQIMFLERTEEKLKGEVIKGIFEDGVQQMINRRYEGGLKEDKKVSLNMGTYRWNDDLERIYQKACDNFKLMIKLPNVDLDGINKRGGVFPAGIATAIFNMMSDDMANAKGKEKETGVEMCVARVFEYDRKFMMNFVKEEDVQKVLVGPESGLKLSLEAFLDDVDMIYISINGDQVRTLNSIGDE